MSGLAGSAAVALTDVSVAYGPLRALDGLSLTVPTGTITALLGPNGAGKSTTVSVIAGLITPSTGRARVLNEPPGSLAARTAIGVMLQEGGIPTGATGPSIVRHHAALRGAPETANPLISELGLAAMGRTTFRRMSGGQKRLVALACALVGHPRLVIVDEPTAGLDPTARRQTWERLHRLRECGTTVLLCTHDLDEAERLGDHIIILSGGRRIIQGSRADLLADVDDAIVFDGPLHLDTASLLEALPAGARVAEVLPGRYRVTGAIGPSAASTVTAWTGQHGIPHHRLRFGTASLEDLYFRATGDDGAGTSR